MTQVLASCDRCSWQLVTTSEALAQLLLQKHHQLQHRPRTQVERQESGRALRDLGRELEE